MIKESRNLIGWETQLATTNQKWLSKMLPSLDLRAKNLKYHLICSTYIVDLIILQFHWTRSTIGHTQTKVVLSEKKNMQKKLRYQLIISRDTDDKRILESDWTIDTTGPTYAKAVVSDATFSWWLSPCNKSKIWIDSFQRYWWSDHHAIWLVESILAHNWRLQIYPRHAAFAKALRTWLCIIFG